MQNARANPGRESFSKLLFLMGSIYPLFYAILLVAQAASLLAGGSLNDASVLLAASLAVGYYWAVGGRLYRLPGKLLGAGLAGAAVICLACGWMAAYFFDLGGKVRKGLAMGS